MMRQFDLPQSRRVRIWLDEAPPADFTATSTVTCLVKPTAIVSATRTTAGIEVNIPRGARSSYGLLGAELVEADVDGLQVVVSVNKVGFPFQGSLALKPDEVQIGLLDEYANAVAVGVRKVAESSGAPTRAALRFRWAAHARVGSSPSVFEKVSGVVTQLLTLPNNASDDELLAVILA